MRKSKRSIIILLMAGSLAIQGFPEFIGGGYCSLIKPFAMAETEKETEEKTMAKYVTRVSKSGETESYAVKDSGARELISAEVSAREAAVSAEATARQQAITQAVSAEAQTRAQAIDAEEQTREANDNKLSGVLESNQIIDIFKDGVYTDTVWRGITLVWNNKIATISGTATDGNFYSPQIFNNSNAFPQNISAGDIITINIIHETADVHLDVFSYVNGEWTNEAMIPRTQQYTIPSNATGFLMRLFVFEGKTVNGNFSFTITKSATVKSGQEILPIILPGKDSIVDTIEASLNKYGIAVLGKGTYEIVRPISMPSNSIIRGAGEATVIKTFSDTDAIIAGASCIIEDVRIHSDVGHSGDPGAAAGIRITGYYDTPPLKYNIKICNVTIDGFTLAGIYGAKTGTWVGDSISAVNCTIFNCYAGLFLEDYSEFGRFTNIMCRDNYIGVLNKSGNNVFENCSFSNNTVGVYLIGDEGDSSRNNGHGSVIGCTINHSNNNQGFAVICRGIDGNGFVFNACQIWYGKIQIEESTGIIFSNCMFGAYNTDTEIINYTANDLFLMNCLFKVGATFSGSGGETHTINCFKFNGEPVSIN